jgi:hypothetical protein
VPPLSIAALIPVVLAASPVHAGVRAPGGRDVPCDPALRSSFVYSASSASCQHRFHAAGALDEMSVLITLRDCFDVPVPACSVDVTLTPNAGTLAFCACGGAVFGAMTDADGVAEITFSSLGGRGTLELAITSRCFGSIALDTEEIQFTTPDLSGSCESAPASATTVVDLGIWATGIFPYQQESDFDCDGTIGIIDLGIWASGLGVGCGD